MSKTYQTLNTTLSNTANKKNVLILLLRSGRFASAIYNKEKCLAHKVCTRYTTRRGQGGAQSSNDNSKGKAKSMGAQLRRAGEEGLVQDMRETFLSWKGEIDDCFVVLLALPNNMKKSFFEEAMKDVMRRDDVRIRRIPIAIKRPSFEVVKDVYGVMMSVVERDVTIEEKNVILGITQPPGNNEESTATTNNTEPAKIKHVDNVPRAATPPPIPPSTPFHDALMTFDLETLANLLENESLVSFSINFKSGPIYETPLHLAARGLPTNKEFQTVSTEIHGNAVEAVRLLLRLGADPTSLDLRGRVPYFMAGNDKLRLAFRLGRAEIGEAEVSGVDWELGRVPPAVTEGDLELKKEKEKEKARKKKDKQKALKKEQALQANEEKLKRLELDEKEKKIDEAKRIRYGLAAKSDTTSENACDFCQTEVRRKKDMFARLEWFYCSTECVKKHQRELQANAAAARFAAK